MVTEHEKDEAMADQRNWLRDVYGPVPPWIVELCFVLAWGDPLTEPNEDPCA